MPISKTTFVLANYGTSYKNRWNIQHHEQGAVSTNLHLADSAGQVPAGEDGHDKLYKICSFMDLLTQQFFDNYIPTSMSPLMKPRFPTKVG